MSTTPVKNPTPRRPLHSPPRTTTTTFNYFTDNANEGNFNKTSPLLRRKQQQQENAFEDEETNNTQDSNIEDSDDENNKNYYGDRSTSVPRTVKFTPESPIRASTHNSKGADSGSRIPYIAVFLFVIVIAIAYGYNTTKTSENKSCRYEKLRKALPQQPDKVWTQLSVGIENILNKRVDSPAVYLFAHHGGRTIEKFIRQIAEHSSQCFDKKMTPIEMPITDFTSTDTDYGHVIERFKMKIKKGNVILVVNLNEIPAEAARALHTICDTYSPIAKDVVIFLSLTTSSTEPPSLKLAEDTLTKLWGAKLPRYELDPLITRLTDEVILLQS